MDLSEMMESDAQEQVARHFPTDEEMRTVAELANEQLRLEKLVSDRELELRTIKDQLAKVREVDLPKAFEAFSITGVKLLDDTTVNIKEEIFSGITEENKSAAFAWLEETGNDGIIKNEIKVPFGKGQDADAKVASELLTTAGFSFSNNRSVHPQTLKAFVRTQLADGEPIPTDIFSIHVKKTAEIKLPRKK